MSRFKWPSRFLLVLIFILAIVSFFAQKSNIEEELGGIELEYTLVRSHLFALTVGSIIERRVFYRPYTTVCILMDNDRVIKWSGYGKSESVLLQRISVNTDEEVELGDGKRCRLNDVLRVDSILFSRFFRLMEI